MKKTMKQEINTLGKDILSVNLWKIMNDDDNIQNKKFSLRIINDTIQRIKGIKQIKHKAIQYDILLITKKYSVLYINSRLLNENLKTHLLNYITRLFRVAFKEI